MNGIIHIVGADRSQWWIDGEDVKMVCQEGLIERFAGRGAKVVYKNGGIGEFANAIYVEIITTKPTETETESKKVEDEQPPADYRNDKLNGKLFEEMNRIETIEREEYKRKFPHGCCNRSGNAVRFLNVVKDHDIETVGQLLEAGSKSVSRMLNIGQKTIEEVSLALENVYGITEW
jgi:hypothetical protein